MKTKILLMMVTVIFISSSAIAQEISRDEILQAEWEMKSRYFQKLEDARTSSILLNQTDFDVLSVTIDITIPNVYNPSITGIVTMTSKSNVNGLSSISYNLDDQMTIENDGVKVDGEDPEDYSHSDNMLTIDFVDNYNIDDQFTTEVRYGGNPTGTGTFVFDTHGSGNDPIIWTYSQPEGAREWWPCKDTPSDKINTADIYITVPVRNPDDLKATSNGSYEGVVYNVGNTKTFNWYSSHAITTYLISLAISDYEIISDPYSGIPIKHYVYPELEQEAAEDFTVTHSALECFIDLFGDYPFEKYGHSIYSYTGGMEHQCNTSYPASCITGTHVYDWLVVHETAHQWFGNMITCDTWADIWMNEGFASYLEALWVEDQGDLQAYLDYMTSSLRLGVNFPNGPIYDPDPLFNKNTVYHKGAWVLHMLRGVMGDNSFFNGMDYYANHNDHQYGTVQTLEFRDKMEVYYGDLDWYFYQWVWCLDGPKYRYSWMSEEIVPNEEYEVFLHIDQYQDEQTNPDLEYFTMPIRVYDDTDSIATVWNDSRSDDFSFTVESDPVDINLDIDNWILKEALVEEDYTMNIVTTELPDGTFGVSYGYTIEARGGEPSYSFSVTGGSLPSGLSLSQSGVLSGTPTVTGPFVFTVQCIDSSDPQLTDDQEFTLVINTTCEWVVGDVNGSDSYNGLDILYGVNFFKGGPAPTCTFGSCDFPPCDEFYYCGDVNGSCSYTGQDITYGINFFNGGPAPVPCPDCPPAE
ncbi:MAG: putative Ig domain-containing protein [Candidatus Zixiibacteriota bacterium]|nr:MAG: putative Ig domain-containing protein [candidate division Zixibacteria bacterium]